jgi:flagellum-specific ATP synthase
MATHAEVEDLLRIGAYVRGSNQQVEKALELKPAIDAFLKQDIGEKSDFAQTQAAMLKIASAWPY